MLSISGGVFMKRTTKISIIVNYIQDVIDNNYDNLYNSNQEGFFDLYLGYRNLQ